MKSPLRLRWQALTNTISITLVLVLLGCIVQMVLTARVIRDRVRENVEVTLTMHDDTPEDSILAFRQQLLQRPYIKDAVYTSREAVLQEEMQLQGYDPSVFMEGLNPYLSELKLTLEADYVCTDSLQMIETQMRGNLQVAEVIVDRRTVENVNYNLQRISWVLLGLAAVLMLISFTLINNTVRLSIYSRRFLIHTMKLVGASWGFIRRPFLIRGLWIGLIAGVVADGVLLGILHLLTRYDAEALHYITLTNVVVMAVSVLGFGVLLTIFCTYVCLGRFLRMKARKMYN